MGEDDPENPAVVKVKGFESAGRLVIPAAGAAIQRPANWVWRGEDSTLHYHPPGSGDESAILMKVIKPPAQTDFLKRREELKQGTGLPSGVNLGAQDTFAFLDGVFACSEVVFRYMRDGIPYARYYYLVQGPNEAVFQVEFDGPENVLNLTMQSQVRGIMQSWTYRK
jgi:hypothetical protein